MTTPRPVTVVVAVVLSLLVLSGCAGLPSSSGIVVGKAIDAPDDSEPLAVEPLTASAYDDPRQIAAGFLRAHISSHDDYRAARTFLTPAATRTWKPGGAVTVFGSDADITATRPDTSTVRLVVPVVATISADGRLTRPATPTKRTLEFRLFESRGGWRLASVPAGLGVWMSDADVSRLYTRANVYYAPAHGRSLVPDPRWLPRQGLATALARAALSSPPEWLAPAVAAPLPAGASLAVDAVPVREGTAEVSLTAQAASTDDARRAALWAAMTATVLQAPEVRALNLRVNGSRLETENLPANVTEASQLGYVNTVRPLDAVVSRSGTYLAWTQAQASDAVSGTDKAVANGRPRLPAVPADWSLLAVGQGGRQIAAVSRDRTSVRRWLNGTDVTVGSLGTGLVRPAFDASGWLWVAGHAFSNATGGEGAQAGERSGSLWALDTTTGSSTPTTSRVSIPWLGSASIDSVSLSPEGSRVLLTVSVGKDRRALVAAVERDKSGRPTRLGPAHAVAVGVDDIRDAVWADAVSVAVLGDVAGSMQPAVQTIDDQVVPLGPVAGADGLVSTMDGVNGLFVRTSAQSVYTRLGSAWSSFLSRGDLIAPRG